MVSKFKLIFRLFGLCLILQAGAISVVGNEARASEPLDGLIATIRESLKTLAPHDSRRGPRDGAFLGSYDWHSAVHGYWSLLSVGRLLPRYSATSQAVLTDDLSLERMRAERRFLKQNPNFELPYGQSWLLLLLEEFRHRPDLSTEYQREVTEFREEVTQRIYTWLLRYSFPELRRGGILKTHTSWLMTFFLATLAELERVLRGEISPWRRSFEGLYELRVKPQLSRILNERQMQSQDFVYPPSLAWMVANFYERSTQGTYSGDVIEPNLPIDSQNQHRSGAAALSLWGWGDACRRGQSGACELFQERFERWSNDPEVWRGSFEWTSHFVPQFLWMAWYIRHLPADRL